MPSPLKGDFVYLHIEQIEGKLPIAQQRPLPEQNLAHLGDLETGGHGRCKGGVA
jgi:hypothetical protein